MKKLWMQVKILILNHLVVGANVDEIRKKLGAWTLDYRPDFTAKETDLDTFINWDKDFIGRENVKKTKAQIS